MGIEAVKSSTPAPCRKMIKMLKLMMTGTEEDVIHFIDKCREDFKKLPPEQISFPRSVSDVVKYKSSSDIYSKELLFIVVEHFLLIIILREQT